MQEESQKSEALFDEFGQPTKTKRGTRSLLSSREHPTASSTDNLVGELKSQVDGSWQKLLEPLWQMPEVAGLMAFLQSELARDPTAIYPPVGDWLRALTTTPLSKVRVVIVGQDPYHGPGQAHGLAFSVNRGVSIPPSLRNIYKELHQDLGLEPARYGNLSAWSSSGVLLLNTALTVRSGSPSSHSRKGWQTFTDHIIAGVSDHQEAVVFMLWGAHAQKRVSLIDQDRHLVLESAHPSPLAARRGFFGSRPFSKANAWLKSKDKTPIDWSLPE